MKEEQIVQASNNNNNNISVNANADVDINNTIIQSDNSVCDKKGSISLDHNIIKIEIAQNEEIFANKCRELIEQKRYKEVIEYSDIHINIYSIKANGYKLLGLARHSRVVENLLSSDNIREISYKDIVKEQKQIEQFLKCCDELILYYSGNINLRTNKTRAIVKDKSTVANKLRNYFAEAAKCGDIELVNLLVKYTPDPATREAMIHANNNYAFTGAASNGHLHIIEKLLKLTPDPTTSEDMIHANNNYAFAGAASNGHLDVIEKLLELTPPGTTRENMIHANNNYAFRWAAAHGHLHIIEKLLKLTPDPTTRENMIHAQNDHAFIGAASNGHLHIIEKLLELTPPGAIRENMIHAKKDHAFRCAAENGHLDTALLLLAIIKANNPERQITINIGTAKKIIVGRWPKHFKDIDSVDYMVDVYSSLMNEHKFPISKLPETVKLAKSVSSYMRSCKDPLNALRLPRDSMVQILSTESKLNHKESNLVINIIEKINNVTKTKEGVAKLAEDGHLHMLERLLGLNSRPEIGMMKFVDRLHDEIKSNRGALINREEILPSKDHSKKRYAESDLLNENNSHNKRSR